MIASSAITKQPIEVRKETTENHCTRELGIIVISVIKEQHKEAQ